MQAEGPSSELPVEAQSELIALESSMRYELQAEGPQGWPGPLAKGNPKFATVVQAEKHVFSGAQPAQQATLLYPGHDQHIREDRLNPNLRNFPELLSGPTAPNHFLAHYDAAGGARPYGMHAPWFVGSKLSAVLRAIDGMSSRGSDGGSKAVVFSASKGALDLLQVLLIGEYGEEAVAYASGDINLAQRSDEISTFLRNPRCFVLLLTVGACAAGLNLTAADHCFLLEPQANVGKELQLVNRIYRIGQTRPVIVKKFFCTSTVEERLLALRKSKNSGLLANADAPAVDAIPDADAMAVPEVGIEEGASDGAMPVKIGDLRSVFGLH